MGNSFFTTETAPDAQVEFNALMQARRGIALALPSVADAASAEEAERQTAAEQDAGPLPAALTALDALHTAPPEERGQAARTVRGLLETLQSAALQKQSVDNMIALLMQETRAARRRRRVRQVRNSAMLLGIVWLLWVTHGRFLNLWWLFNFGGGWWAIEQSAKRRETISELGKAGDPRAVGALAVAVRDGDASIQHAASEALLTLLPRVRASDAVHIPPDQMNALLELAFRSHFYMQLAVLQALEQIGDQRAIPVVQNLALSPHRAVREQAAQCLPFLMARARQAEQSATLLRGAASPTMTGGARELLRPAKTRPEDTTRPDELLRSSTDAA